VADTIPAVVRAAAARYPDAIAVAEPGGERLTYPDLLALTSQVARAFVAAGIEPGDRVAIWSPNTHHWVAGALGALYAGATLVPVNTRFTGPEALDVIARSGARALLVAGPFLGSDRHAVLATAAEQTRLALPGLIVQIPVQPAEQAGVPDTGILDWRGFLALADRIPVAAADQRAAAVTPDDVSDILFTSGTTGRSKGAMSSHRQAIDVARAWARCAELTSADRYLIVNPFFHSFGYKAGILACLLTGATIVPQLTFDPGQTLRLIASERITVLPGAPTIYSSLLDHPHRRDHDLSSLRLAVTGAAVVPVALVERMRAELSFDLVLTAYGLT
jgi:HIP---CoA ligase